MTPLPTCPRGHLGNAGLGPYRRSYGCSQCRLDDAMTNVVALLIAGQPLITTAQARAAVAGSARRLQDRDAVQAWLVTAPDGLHSGRSDLPPAGLRLITELERLGVSVTRPRCADCGRTRRLYAPVAGGRICDTCVARRTSEPCSHCGETRRVYVRLSDGQAVCEKCRPASLRPCGRCGAVGRRVGTLGGVSVGRCCYVAPQLRCTICGVTKGLRPHKTRRPVCATCADGPRDICVRCGLDAPAPSDSEQPVCARCRTTTAQPCSGCGSLTTMRSIEDRPRCPDCYTRRVGACGRCQRTRTIVRLATGGDPDLCGGCWRGPVMTCQGCGKVGPCRGERGGQMLCQLCRPSQAQTCSHCGRSRPPAAQWHEGPVCIACYRRALEGKGQCPDCGQHRRLRHYPGFAEQVCTVCAGVPAENLCTACGAEERMLDKGLCPRCSLPRRLGVLLGGSDARRRNGMAPLFDAFLAAPRPRAVVDWLYHNHNVSDALGRTARGDVPLSHAALDALEPMLGLRAHRHLGNLLMATGALPVRDSVLAALERWCDRRLAAVDHPEHERILRAYARWQILRPLRLKSQRALLRDAAGYSARTRLQVAAAFAAWLLTRQHTLATCTQSDVDEWLRYQPTTLAANVRAFITWAARRDLIPVVDVPVVQTTLAAPVLCDERWSVARRLISEPGIAATDRLAGSLVVIYAQPLARIARLTLHDIHSESACVTVRLGRVGVELPEPLSDVARDLVEQPRAVTGKAKTTVDRGWLFVGADPDQPIRAESLGRRLRRVGVRAGPHRLAALYQLAADMPPSILAELLGIHPTTADRWSRLASRPWRDYLALRAQDDHS